MSDVNVSTRILVDVLDLFEAPWKSVQSIFTDMLDLKYVAAQIVTPNAGC